ncbi:MAG: FHA domain-containing protein [Ignavibacterium sp.]|nr:FHA domain-containing protein [Ignavibacterium sp.]MCX7610997.1 FHA domain-containing protein [Ignavibacterium sp.]MDW8376349.1 FHA domain-containing protein [Ignavibacteriales bacterium]
MKCNNCKKENPDLAKFCKHCGSPLQEVGFKTCINGHNYKASLSKCPFCPSTDYEQTVRDLDNEKTLLDSSVNKNPNSDDAKTIIDTSAPTIKRPNQLDDQKTILIDVNRPLEGIATRKLVGWIVTFDLNPNGTDFKLFEGRNVIGRSKNCDIVVDNRSISDKHCTILYRNEKFIISDELSTNGTYVNNEMIEDKTYLKDNDLIKLGTVNFKIKII